jgi:hypothetical protein
MMARAAIALVAFFAAAVLAGCGGGDGENGTSSTAPSAVVPSHERPEADVTVSPRADSKPPTDPGSLPNEGGKAVAPGVPLAKGGDNSIQTFGVAAPRRDRLEVAAAAQAYLDARVLGNWDEACSDLAAPTRVQLGKLVDSGTCADAMAALSAGVPKTKLQIAADIEVLSMRVRGNRGFLIYRNGEGTPSAIAIHRERGGEWRVGVIDGSALVL